jgi:hypothetical protein
MSDAKAVSREVERLRVYLYEWVQWQANYQPALGAPRVCAFARGAREDSISATDFLERSDKWAMEVIDTAFDDLTRRLDGMQMRVALRMRLLNESAGAQVFRGRSLKDLTPSEIDDLADRAEREMVLIVKAKGLPL